MVKLTGSVAKQAGATRETVRAWGSRFAHWLSPEASAEGETRYYTEHDIQVLRAIKHSRDMALSFDDIADKLADGAHLALSGEEPTADPLWKSPLPRR